VAGRKSNFGSKKCGCQQFKFQDTKIVAGGLGVIQIYRYSLAVCDTNETVNYPTEVLNSLDLPGMPPRHLQLKVGSPIITS